MGYDKDFDMYCCFYYVFESRKSTSFFALSQNLVFSTFKCTLTSSILKCSDLDDIVSTRYSQKKRIKSEVIRTNNAKVSRKDVIKGVIKSEIKGDDTGCVIKARASLHIRDAEILYFIHF